MGQQLFVVDAFTNQPFAGNPAAVCLTSGPVDETWMKHVAREMNLSETAFLHPIEGGYSLRWLTPTVEEKLCGHATLASAFTLWDAGFVPRDLPIRFFTQSGWLVCRRAADWIEMDFPAKVATPCAPPDGLAAALGCELLTTAGNGMDYLVEVRDAETLRGLRPNFSALATLPVRGVIATCGGGATGYDFLSRFFAPASGINEDPVTGSAHCALGPYWQAKLGKSEFTAYQASARGGVVKLYVQGDSVQLIGQAVLVSRIELLYGPKS